MKGERLITWDWLATYEDRHERIMRGEPFKIPVMSANEQLRANFDLLIDALVELQAAVEAKADIGEHRQKTVSPRMEDALIVANANINAARTK
jgi:hypothetical protein